jgi:plastocyanin
MRRITPLLALVSVAALQAACTDSGTVTRPTPTAAAAARASAEGGSVRRIEMHDACDPMSFNNAIGEGTCTRSGGVKFDRFIAQLTKKGVAEAWRFTPKELTARVGTTLMAINRGGEAHTFTEVEEFGGGIVPLLNQLSGNTEVAPECLALAPADFIPPGGFDADDEVEEPGTELYQCCIHPWMRTVVHGKA